MSEGRVMKRYKIGLFERYLGVVSFQGYYGTLNGAKGRVEKLYKNIKLDSIDYLIYSDEYFFVAKKNSSKTDWVYSNDDDVFLRKAVYYYVN